MAVPTGDTCCFAIRAPLLRCDLPGLRARICRLLTETHPGPVLCDVSGVAADAVAVDALARLQLAASRYGCCIWLAGAGPELRGLLALSGLAEVFPDAP